jgi:hypothetical protein
MTADGGRLYASFQDKCTHVGYVVHTLGMNARQYGSIENRHRMFFGLVRSDIHDKLGPMMPPMPTTTSQADMRTMREALLPADSPLIPALIDKSSCWKRFRTPAEHEPHHIGPKMEMWCADRRCGAY